MTANNESCALVIGGGGFIGSHLVKALLLQGRRVRVLELPHRTRTQIIPYHSTLEWLEGNYANIGDISTALCGADIVFHLASTTQPQSSNENPSFDIESNLLPTIGLLEQIRKIKNIPIIFISSGGVIYGKPEQIPIPETHPTEPKCSYAIVKMAIEKYLALYHLLYGINYRVLRLANPYGPGQETNRAQGVIGVFMSCILEGKTIEVWGDGSVVRDYLYVGDAVEALLMAEHYQGNQRVFNVGSGIGYSVKEIIATLGQLTGQKAKIHYKPGRDFDVPVNVLDIELAKRELGWIPRTSLDEGLCITLECLRQPQHESRE